MTLFEYITVVVSIVLSFGMIRLLDGLRPALSREGRYWVSQNVLDRVSCLFHSP